MPLAAPHVGQGTEDNCLGVRSVILIRTECDETDRKAVPFGTIRAQKICARKGGSLQNRVPDDMVGTVGL